MNVLLIAANTATVPYPVYPLGMSVVAGAVQRAGHRVSQCDFLVAGQSLDAIHARVVRENPDVVGISIRNVDNVNLLNEQRYIDVVKDLVDTVRAAGCGRVILGGSGFTIFPDSILRATGADFGLVGEGEESLPRLLTALAAGEKIPHAIIHADVPRLTKISMNSALYDPELVDYYMKHSNVIAVQTKRGCAHKCVYCSYPMLEGDETRSRDPEQVVDDIQHLIAAHKAELLFFTDSIFNDDDDAYLDVLRAMARRGVRVPWTAFFKPAAFSEEAMELFKTTGLKAIELGSDAACDTTLKGLNKAFTFADIRRTNDQFAAAGVAVAHYYMFGGPGETADTVREGVKNILSLKHCVSFMFMGIRILPGTPLEKLALKQGIITPETNLLEGGYYLSPDVDADWMEKELTDAFAHVRNCVFPPDAMAEHVQLLHKLGYTGLLWDMLIT
ncbi:MAG: lipid biosynthesis B12-binding/radical SAM protein [Lentisphaeria bacterium]|nr:lipid biosynthesis B12-binding/radical SAM protein [Lentisphaeria bacterium]